MKRAGFYRLMIILIIFIILGGIYYFKFNYVFEDKNINIILTSSLNNDARNKDIREIVWGKLNEDERRQIVGSWKKGKVERITVDKQMAYLEKDKYYGIDLIHVIFKTVDDDILGPLGFYLDPITKDIVGWDYRH